MRIGYKLTPEQLLDFKCDQSSESLKDLVQQAISGKIKRSHIVIPDLTVLGDTLKNIIDVSEGLKSRKVWIFSIAEGIDTKKMKTSAILQNSPEIEKRLLENRQKRIESTMLHYRFKKRKRKLPTKTYGALRYEHNKSHAEIARLKGISVRAVEYVAAEYRQELRNKLQLSRI